VRLLVGAHTSMHDFTMHGVNWLAEPFWDDSGYRSTQFMVLSEHYEMLFTLPRLNGRISTDYLYNTSASYEGLTNGAWGLLRSWNPAQRPETVAEITPPAKAAPPAYRPPPGMGTDCAKRSPCIREYEVHAMTVQQATGGPLTYNKRGANLLNGASDTAHPLEDPLALVYVAVPKGQRHKPQPNIEPLVLRANAGDWIHVTLVNQFTGNEPVFKHYETASRFGLTYATPYDYIKIASSRNVGLHTQLLAYDAGHSDGANIGRNPVQTAPPKGKVDYWWYAGKIDPVSGAATPVEFGTVNLMPADPLMQVYRGLFGALVVEPAGSRWTPDPLSPTSATVWHGDKVFREFVVMYQNDANMLTNQNSWWETGNPLAGFNYKSEPAWLRFGKHLDGPMGNDRPKDWTRLTQDDLQSIALLSMTNVDETPTTANQLVGADPQTPIFRAPAHMPARFRLLMPGGDGDNQITWELTGHVWQESPYRDRSTRIGHNPQSGSVGTLTGFGPTSAYDIVLADTPGSAPAGGRFGVPGDYLYRAWTANIFQGGAWGVFRVAPWNRAAGSTRYPDTVGVSAVTAAGGGATVSGFATPCPTAMNDGTGKPVCAAGETVRSVAVNGRSVPVRDGLWQVALAAAPATVTVQSPAGGSANWASPTRISRTAKVLDAADQPRRRPSKPVR
jgi:hypothetical protein